MIFDTEDFAMDLEEDQSFEYIYPLSSADIDFIIADEKVADDFLRSF